MYLTDEIIEEAKREAYDRHKPTDKICYEEFDNLVDLFINDEISKYQISDNHKILIEFFGLLGELVFRQFLKYKAPYLKIEHDTEVYEGGDEYDFIINNNYRIDVKTASRHFHKEFRIKQYSYLNHNVDYFVSVKLYPEKRRGRVVGFLTQKEVGNLPTKLEENTRMYFCKLNEIHDIYNLPFINKSYKALRLPPDSGRYDNTQVKIKRQYRKNSKRKRRSERIKFNTYESKGVQHPDQRS